MLRVAVVGGVLIGVGLELLTWVLAEYGPQGGDGVAWSLRGNGALVVPLGLGPVVLAGAWSAYVLHSRGAVRWRQLGLLALLIGAGLVVLSLVSLMLGAVAGYTWLSLTVSIWMILAPLLCAVVPVARVPVPPRRLQHLGAAVVFTVVSVVSYVVASRVLPPGA